MANTNGKSGNQFFLKQTYLLLFTFTTVHVREINIFIQKPKTYSINIPW